MQLTKTPSHKSHPNQSLTLLCSLLFATAATLSSPALASQISELPAPLQQKVDQGQQACSDFENGNFALEWGAVTRVDLDGDLRPDWALNEAFFTCSSAASLYCGTGGCMSHFLVGDTLSSVLNRGWDVVDLGPDRVLLTDVHGSQCGGINPTPCVTASTWDTQTAQWRSSVTAWE